MELRSVGGVQGRIWLLKVFFVFCFYLNVCLMQEHVT